MPLSAYDAQLRAFSPGLDVPVQPGAITVDDLNQSLADAQAKAVTQMVGLLNAALAGIGTGTPVVVSPPSVAAATFNGSPMTFNGQPVTFGA